MRTRQLNSVMLVGLPFLTLALGGCPQPTTGGDAGGSDTGGTVTADANAGAEKFQATCQRCHTATSIKSEASRITNNMATVSLAMSGITLTDQEVADLKAFLATQ